MLKEAIGTGSTIDAAKEAALAELNAPVEAEIKFETLEFPSKKVLGLFGGSPAKVKVSYEAPDVAQPKQKDTGAAAKKVTENTKPAKANTAKKPEQSEKASAKAKGTPEGFAVCNSEAEAYISAILKGMGLSEIKVSSKADDESVSFEIECGDNYGSIIGRRGETLDAIQYLTRLVVNKNGGSDYKRVSINIGNYREKREQTLQELAKKYSEKVKKYGRNFTLDPMNPYERRVIHTTVQDIEGVSSHSVGDDANRRVIITPNDEYKKPQGNYNSGYNNGRGRYNNNNRGNGGGNKNGGNRNGGNRGGGYNNRRPASSSGNNNANENRAPRSDVHGATLYGKIETKKPE